VLSVTATTGLGQQRPARGIERATALGRFETLPAAHWRRRIKANRGDPGYTLTISAPTNADAREIDAAIVADRPRSGELGEDIRSSMRSIAPVRSISCRWRSRPSPAAADRAERRGSPSDKISGLRPYP
jgi:hypothetical protein